MNRLLAKMLVLPILLRGDRMTIWLVKWSGDLDTTECRWFRSEAKARDFMAIVPRATILPSEFTSDDHPTLSDDYPTAVAVPYEPDHR